MAISTSLFHLFLTVTDFQPSLRPYNHGQQYVTQEVCKIVFGLKFDKNYRWIVTLPPKSFTIQHEKILTNSAPDSIRYSRSYGRG